MNQRLLLPSLLLSMTMADWCLAEPPNLKKLAGSIVKDKLLFFQKPVIHRSDVGWNLTVADVRQNVPDRLTALEVLLYEQLSVELYRQHMYTAEDDRALLDSYCDVLDTTIASAVKNLWKRPRGEPETKKIRQVNETIGNTTETIVDAVQAIESIKRDTSQQGLASSIARRAEIRFRGNGRNIFFMPITQWRLNQELDPSRQFEWREFRRDHAHFMGAFRFRTVKSGIVCEKSVVLDYDHRDVVFPD